jgi:hypothetical protein
LFEFEDVLCLNRFAMALIDELVTSVLLVTADCSAILLARCRPFLGFLSFLLLSFLYFILLERRGDCYFLLLTVLEALWFGLEYLVWFKGVSLKVGS